MGGSASKMNMPVGGASALHHGGRLHAFASSHAAAQGMRAAHTMGIHPAVPVWLGIVGAVMFLGIAASHLRHLANTEGQRRAWHACHVLIAVGMASMYSSAAITSLTVPAVFWKLVFAGAGVLTAVWAVNETGRAPTPMWLLTAIDLGAMIYMWSSHAFTEALSWLLVGYFVIDAVLWALDEYRHLDRNTLSISWRMLSPASGGTTIAAPAVGVRSASQSLIGELDIGLSMVAMALGMAYMLAAMQIIN
jgi:hypothetical protein